MSTEQAQVQARLDALQEALPPLQEQAAATQKALKAAEANRTPEGLEALIAAQQQVKAAGEMLRQQQADISAAQAEISRLEAAARQTDLEAEHARNLQAYQDLMTKWEAAAKKFGKGLHDQIEALYALEVEVSEARRQATDSRQAASAADEVPELAFSISQAASDYLRHMGAGAWEVKTSNPYKVSGYYRQQGFNTTKLPRHRRPE